MGVLSFLRGVLRWLFIDIPKGLLCLALSIMSLCQCKLGLAWHYLLVAYQLLLPLLASYCRFIRQPRPPNSAPHTGQIKEVHSALPERSEAVRAKLAEVGDGPYHQELQVGSVDSKAGPLQWKRAGKDVAAGSSLFGSTRASASDVGQGGLGSCYLLSSLAVLTEAPGGRYLEDKLFLPTNGDKGLYGVRCFLDGKETDLWVSDELPVGKDGNLAFAHGNDGKLWPAIGEKALATAYGSYAAIEGGNSGDALSDLTGAPYRRIKLQGADQWMLWHELRTAVDSGFVMAAETSDLSTAACCLYMPFCLTWLASRLSSCLNRHCCFLAGLLRLAYDVMMLPFRALDLLLKCFGLDCCTAMQISSLGLVPTHAYSVLTAAQSEGCLLGVCCREQAVCIRNPWGKQEFKFALKNFKPAKGSAAASKLDVEQGGGGGKDDGVFWMSMHDFSRYYETLHILWLMPDAYRTAATVGLSGGWGLFELKAESSVTGFLTLHQRRGKEAGLRMCVLSGDGSSRGGTDDNADQAYFGAEGTRSTGELALQAGSYTVLIEQLNRQPLEFVLSAYFRVTGGGSSQRCVSLGPVGTDRFDGVHEFKLPRYTAQYVHHQ